MDFYDKQQVYIFNNERRNRLLLEAQKQPGISKKMQYVVDYFLNHLPANEIAKIDNVFPDKIKMFQYDYSFLDDNNEPFPRQQTREYYTPGRSALTLHQADVDSRSGKKAKIYPTIFALKKATCQMFANEIERFAMDFGIDSKIMTKITACYDYFDGKNINGEKVQQNRIENMLHYYNILTLDGKQVKVDIAGALTAIDCMKNNPSVSQINTADFYFSEDIDSNPFESLNLNPHQYQPE